MAEGDQLGRTPDLRYFKERVISAPEGDEAAVAAAQQVTPFMLQDTIKNFEGLLGKIDVLLEQIRKTAKDRIPVHPDAHEARAALRRLFPGAIEDFVLLDQYLAAIDYTYKRTSMDAIDLVGSLTGNLEVDGRIISQEQWLVSDGITPKELAVITGQTILCYVANRIMQPYQAPDVQKQTAGKMMVGTEAGAVAAQVLIGLAALLLQVCENTEEVSDFMNNITKEIQEFNNQDVNSIVSQAAARGNDPIIDRYNTAQRPYYYDVLIRYCEDYIQSTSEPGYEGWMAATRLADQKADGSATLQELKKYADDNPSVASLQGDISKALYKMAWCQMSDTNDQVDRLAAVLNSKYTGDLLCCFVLFLGAIPTDTLKIIRFILAVSSEGMSLDMGRAIRGLSGRTNQWLAEKIVEPALHNLHRFWDGVREECLKVIDRHQWVDQELYDILMECAPIDELIELMLNGLEKLEALIQGLIRKAWSRLRLKNVQGNFAIQVMADSKKAKMMLAILDKIIALIERGNLCLREGGVTPAPDELEDLINQVSEGLPTPIQVPVGGHPFQTFNLEPFKSRLGLDVQIPALKQDGDGTVPFQTSDCLRRHTSLANALKSLGIGLKLDRELRDARNFEPTEPGA